MADNISSSDFGTSTKRRLPICFALDTSGSMMGNPIRQLNMGLNNFVSSIKNNDDTRNSTDIAIVTFGSKVEIVMPFGKISKDKGLPEITASTTLTPIGEGVLTALELLNARKEGYKERGIKYQFIDMKEKGMSKGELTSVASANGGIMNMINSNAKDKDTVALIQYIADEDKLEKLLENQQIIKTPVVRNGKQSTLGYQPDVWKKWE